MSLRLAAFQHSRPMQGGVIVDSTNFRDPVFRRAIL